MIKHGRFKNELGAVYEVVQRNLKKNSSAIPELKYISTGKKAQVQRLVNDAGSKAVLIDAVEHMSKSDVCNGRKCSTKFPKGWLASFPWMMSSDEIIYDLANGKYDNPPELELTPEEQRKLEREQLEREQEQRRAEAKRIEEKDREAQRRQREYDAAHATRGEELQAIFDELDKQMAEYGGGRDLEKNIKNTACEG